MIVSREMFFGTGGTFALSPRQAAARLRARLSLCCQTLTGGPGGGFQVFFSCWLLFAVGFYVVLLFLFSFFFFKGEEG